GGLLAFCFPAALPPPGLGRQPRFPTFAESGFWKNQAPAAKGSLQTWLRTHATGHEEPYSNVAGSCRSMGIPTKNRTYPARPIKLACRAASNRSATRDRLAGRSLLISRDDPQFTRRSSSL